VRVAAKRFGQRASLNLFPKIGASGTPVKLFVAGIRSWEANHLSGQSRGLSSLKRLAINGLSPNS
jgi:hypothetical protein